MISRGLRNMHHGPPSWQICFCYCICTPPPWGPLDLRHNRVDLPVLFFIILGGTRKRKRKKNFFTSFPLFKTDKTNPFFFLYTPSMNGYIQKKKVAYSSFFLLFAFLFFLFLSFFQNLAMASRLFFFC